MLTTDSIKSECIQEQIQIVQYKIENSYFNLRKNRFSTKFCYTRQEQNVCRSFNVQSNL